MLVISHRELQQFFPIEARIKFKQLIKGRRRVDEKENGTKSVEKRGKRLKGRRAEGLEGKRGGEVEIGRRG